MTKLYHHPQWKDSGESKEVIDGEPALVTKLEVGDTSTHITKDGDGNMVFTDAVTGELTLAELEGGGGGGVDTSGTPVDNDYAKFTDADTIEGRSYTEVKQDLSLEDSDINALITATKLDDLTAPDDTEDLDATDALHGLMSKADKGKLDAIEAGANVTDAANVAAAGALMVADLENPPTEDEATKAPTSEWASGHNAATTGVHGAGANTLLHSGSTDVIGGAQLTQVFGATGGRLSNYVATPLAGKIINYPNAGTSMTEASVFSAVINGNPTSTSIPYDGDSKEGMFAGMSAYDGTNFWGKIILHNTTKSESVKIETVNTATNTITVEANSPDDSNLWDDEDVITCQSQTNAQAGYFDIDMSDYVTSTMVALNLAFINGDTEGNYDAARYIMLHPYEVYDAGKRFWTFATNANEQNGVTVTMPVVGQKLTVFYGAGCAGVSFVLSVLGYYEYADT